MADNTTLNSATVVGGDVIATDDIGGVKYQRNKITLGSDGVNDLDVSKANPMPTTLPSITPIDISGTITTGGTAQILAAARSTRRGWWLRNNSTTSLYVSDITTAIIGAASLEIKVGELYESAYGGCSSSALSIIGATTGQSFTAREY